MQTIERSSIPVNFDLSQLKIRWSDQALVKEGEKVLGEAVVYGGDWERAERLARQIAERKFGVPRGSLTVCEQVFISGMKDEGQRMKEDEVKEIRRRRSNLKVKVGRNVFEDIKRLEYIRNSLKFPYKIRIDANQGYSLKQLQYLIPTLIQTGVHFVEEPVKRKHLSSAIELLHQNGMEVILDETIQTRSDWEWAIKNQLIDVLNLKLARVGDLDEASWYIKQAKKHGIKIIIGCSEELERGMKAIYALGHIAKREGVLLEVEGFGPLRLKNKAFSIPRLINRLENAWLMLSHRMRQEVFDVWWSAMRLGVQFMKETKKLSALSLHLVQWTGKHREKIHPKHLVSARLEPWYLRLIKPTDVVLDIGCGNGQHALRVARSAKHVVGFDLDERQLAIVRRMTEAQGISNVTFERRSAEEPLSYQSQSFDKVIFFAVLEHLEHRDQILDEIHRVLKQKGILLLGVPNEWTSWKITQRRFGIPHYTDPDHKVEYSQESITGELTRHHFRVQSIDPTAYDTPWSGFIDLSGGISLSTYERLLKWKWSKAKQNPQNSISWNIVAEKLR